jgi:hypothetical protein
MVRPGGLELPTFWFVARRSIQLSYGRTVVSCSVSTAYSNFPNIANSDFRHIRYDWSDPRRNFKASPHIFGNSLAKFLILFQFSVSTGCLQHSPPLSSPDTDVGEAGTMLAP